MRRPCRSSGSTGPGGIAAAQLPASDRNIEFQHHTTPLTISKGPPQWGGPFPPENAAPLHLRATQYHICAAGFLACVSSSGTPSQPGEANGCCAFVHAYSRGKTAPEFHRLPLKRHCRNCRYSMRFFVIITAESGKVKGIFCHRRAENHPLFPINGIHGAFSCVFCGAYAPARPLPSLQSAAAST